jgi:hypothetical protein
MSKVLDRLNFQIKRDGELPEHLEVLKLYNLLIKSNICTAMLWGLLTNCKFDKNHNHGYSVKPEVIKFIKSWNN